ncbi:MAG TPA: ATP-binding protein [Steroidobacteraceae bacterium]|nr:ATP-binding protein [Steroidobacteraceae bacterium]
MDDPETPRRPLRTRPVTRNKGLPFQARIVIIALAGGLPALIIAFLLLPELEVLPSVRRLIVVLLLGFWVAFAVVLYRATVEPLRSIANLLEALRGGDYAVRGRFGRKGDALGDIVLESNRLGATLRAQRFEAIEASGLLNKVLAEIDVAVLAFDGDEHIRLANRAAGVLLKRHPDALYGLTAEEAGMTGLVEGPAVSSESYSFPGRSGRWQIMRETFREGGRQFWLLVITDLSQALREEERRAWRRLIRVIWHELNNSLAPIKSVIETSRDALAAGPPTAQERADLAESLALVAERAESLRRFLSRYSELARLPEPTLVDCNVATLLGQVAAVQPPGRVHIAIADGLVARGDADQLQQALINLVRNAVEATPEGALPVEVRARRGKEGIVFEIEDSGPGVANPDNLFVPFFTTKPGGSGIGLVLARQVAEGHGGTLSLQNRPDRTGCIARLVIP